MASAVAQAFLVKLLQKYGQQQANDLNLSLRFTSRHYQRVLTFIQQNLERTISVEDLAREAAMSPSHFSRVFKETVGQTPMQYLLAYRVEQAMVMMKEANRPLGDIALACGFADQSHFSRSFKQVTGQTPRQFRAA